MFPEPHCFCSKVYGAPTGAYWVEEGVAIQGAPFPEVSFSGWGDSTLISEAVLPAGLVGAGSGV